MNGLKRLQAANIQYNIFSVWCDAINNLSDIKNSVLHDDITPIQAKRKSKCYLRIALRNYIRLTNFQKSFECDIELIDIKETRIKYNEMLEFYL